MNVRDNSSKTHGKKRGEDELSMVVALLPVPMAMTAPRCSTQRRQTWATPVLCTVAIFSRVGAAIAIASSLSAKAYSSQPFGRPDKNVRS